jgi:DNA polymerase-3 subunit epsilon
LNPERDSHEDALKVHGISNEFLRDKPKFAEVAQQLVDYLQGADVLIHNAPFDISFLNKELSQTGHQPFASYVNSIADTLVMAKEMFPGKRNSLDALCDRLEVDNSGRTLHGALLDAELLADVYINMTRGQDALLMEPETTMVEDARSTEYVDLSALVLPVIKASEQEISQHQDVLTQLDKASGGQTVWRKTEDFVA